MSQLLWVIIAATIGAMLGTILRPGIPEIVFVALLLVGIAFGVRSVNRKRRAKAAKFSSRDI